MRRRADNPTPPIGHRPVVLLIDDELAWAHDIPVQLRQYGYDVRVATTAQKAVALIQEMARVDVAVIDMRMRLPRRKEFSDFETRGGEFAGLALAKQLRLRFRNVPVIFWTSSRGRELQSRITALGNARLLPKAAGPEPMVELVRDSLEGIESGTRPRTFLVHGHDEETMAKVSAFLTDVLRFPPPVILKDEASRGQTVIEKIESYTYTPDIVFVLLTPDDRVIAKGHRTSVCRPRQNVILELGYFMGVLGRTSGRLVLLVRRPVELPTDIGGVVTVDITEGLGAAGAAIEREVSDWVRR